MCMLMSEYIGYHDFYVAFLLCLHAGVCCFIICVIHWRYFWFFRHSQRGMDIQCLHPELGSTVSPKNHNWTLKSCRSPCLFMGCFGISPEDMCDGYPTFHMFRCFPYLVASGVPSEKGYQYQQLFHHDLLVCSTQVLLSEFAPA